MLLVQAACKRQSLSPTEPMAKVAKSASIAQSIVALQAQKIAQLEASTSTSKRRKSAQKGSFKTVVF
jgi:hypothetical protein